jgi:hypothetical protein
MEKDFLVQLAKDVYQSTLLFPKKEPLRYKIRELAIEILQKPDQQDFEVLNSFFEVAKAQNWVPLSDLLAIQENYAKLAGELVKSEEEEILIPRPEEKKTEAKFQPLTAKTLIERQEKIMAILKEKGRAQVWEMKQIFPQVSKRTLRRDFEFLLKQGVVLRIGEKNNTFYQVKVG